ncbi:hypothetical protein Cgig2_008532 [Carnegiea gigantea]|uniref:E3 ubiquitin-protein ligase PRT1 n=1 Tax=Carnegiea gigantea TaxID=171969 RepID=A0A9Q1JS85_9CARY|nr:hypothetical protein Cgig2_008532 [Carnegiea gigantea]
METKTPDFDDEETISDSFICCVCLDILYKPLVLECGHVSCFWCVHRSMSSLRESHCPICRNAYHHFPTICEMLHFLLLKMYPLAYKRRGKQILEVEKKRGCFSPQLANKQPDEGDESKTSNDEKADGKVSAAIKENSMSALDYDRSSDMVSRTDVLLYCESCLVVPEDEVIICSACESPHPGQVPKVCLEFSNFLEEKFPEEYAVQRKNVERKQLQFRPNNPSACMFCLSTDHLFFCCYLESSNSMKSTKKDIFKAFLSGEDFIPWWNEHGSKVHIGVGCDYCGMYPIVGDRYKCQDCMERMGFDLCGDCYNTCSKRPGRFNQQHTPDHRFQLVKQPDFFRHIMLRLTRQQRVDTSETPILAITAGDESQDSPIVIQSVDAPPVVSDDDEVYSMHVNDSTIDGSIPVEFSNTSEVPFNNTSSAAYQDE